MGGTSPPRLGFPLGSFDLTISKSPVKLTMIFLGHMAKTAKEVQHFYLDIAARDEARKAKLSPKVVRQMPGQVSA